MDQTPQQEAPQGAPQLPFPDVKLLIGIPSQGYWEPEFGMSLMLMTHHMTCAALNFYVQNERGSILPQLRQNLVDMALENEVTHLLFIDSDQTFPPELPLEWLSVKRPVIAANIATKARPCYPTAKKMIGGVPQPHYSDVASERFSKVGRVGTGIMMLDIETLQKLPKPAFRPGWHEELKTYIGEDWALCEHLEKLEVPVVVDNHLSLKVGHIGKQNYGWNQIIATRKAENANDSGPDHKSRIVTAR